MSQPRQRDVEKLFGWFCKADLFGDDDVRNVIVDHGPGQSAALDHL